MAPSTAPEALLGSSASGWARLIATPTPVPKAPAWPDWVRVVTAGHPRSPGEGWACRRDPAGRGDAAEGAGVRRAALRGCIRRGQQRRPRRRLGSAGQPFTRHSSQVGDDLERHPPGYRAEPARPRAGSGCPAARWWRLSRIRETASRCSTWATAGPEPSRRVWWRKRIWRRPARCCTAAEGGVRILTQAQVSSIQGGEGVWLQVPHRTQLDGTPEGEANCGPSSIGMALEQLGKPATHAGAEGNCPQIPGDKRSGCGLPDRAPSLGG